MLIGFHTTVDQQAVKIAEQHDLVYKLFSTIYEAIDWVKEHSIKNKPVSIVREEKGKGKVIQIFSAGQGKALSGIRVESGEFCVGNILSIQHNGKEYEGKIITLQQNHTEKDCVSDFGAEFAMIWSTSVTPNVGDTVRSIEEKQQ